MSADLSLEFCNFDDIGKTLLENMADEILQDVATVLNTEWGIAIPELITEEELLKLLAIRVAALVLQGQEAFYREMYRIDISEKKLNMAKSADDVAAAIAKLIYDRQLAKSNTRLHFKKHQNDIDPDLKW